MNEFPEQQHDEAVIRSLLEPLRDVEAVQPSPDVARHHLAAMLALGEQHAAARVSASSATELRTGRLTRFNRRLTASVTLAAAACAVFAIVAVGVVTSEPQDSSINQIIGDVPELTVDVPEADRATDSTAKRAARHAKARRKHPARQTVPASSSSYWRSSSPRSASSSSQSGSSGGGQSSSHGNSTDSSSSTGSQGSTSGGSTSCSVGGSDDSGTVRSLSSREPAAPPDGNAAATPVVPPVNGNQPVDGAQGDSGNIGTSVGASGGCGGAP